MQGDTIPPQKKEKREEAMQGDTIKKKKRGDNSRADYSPQKWGRYVFIQGRPLLLAYPTFDLELPPWKPVDLST